MNWTQRFHKLDRFLANVLTKIGLKKKGVIFDSNDENYWNSIIERWQTLRAIGVCFYVPYAIYIVSVAEKLKYMNPILVIIPHIIFIFVALVCYNVENVSYRFQRGKEQKHGRTDINGIHIAKIFIFPIVFSLCLFAPFLIWSFIR